MDEQTVAAMRGRLGDLSNAVTTLVARYVEVANALHERLDLSERAEFMQQVSDLLAGVGQVGIRNRMPGQFATPPGSIGAWLVWDGQPREDAGYRLFLNRELADQASGGDPSLTEPVIGWGVAPPASVGLWTVKVSVSADGERLASSYSCSKRLHDPDERPDSLVDPTTAVAQSRGSWWDVFGYGPELAAVNVAVEQTVAELSARIRDGLVQQGINPDRVPRDTDYEPPIV